MTEARAFRALSVTAAVCGALFVVGLFVEPEATWTGTLIGFNALTGLALAGPLFLAFLHIASARWAERVHHVLEAMGSALLPAAAIGLVLLFGVPTLYEWSHADAVAGDAVLQGKSSYLNTTGFAGRLILCFVVWVFAARFLVRGAQRLNSTETQADVRRRCMKRGAIFLLLFAPTYSLASFDWLMSLEPHWFSTIFALRTLSGAGLSGLAAAVVLVVVMRRSGFLRGAANADLFHDAGKLLFSFSLFWAYIWYCEYMLIWYTNMPEETPWFVSRMGGSWRLLSQLSLVLNGLIPFVVLLSRTLRRSESAMLRISAVILVGRLVELYVTAGPPLMADGPALGVWEAAPVVGAIALFFLVALRSLHRAHVPGRGGAWEPAQGTTSPAA